MEKLQIHRLTAEELNIKPGKDGMFFVSPSATISIKEHTDILMRVKDEINSHYLREMGKTGEMERQAYTIEELITAMRYCFEQGQDWAETYSGWFLPKPEQTEAKQKSALTDAIKMIRP